MQEQKVFDEEDWRKFQELCKMQCEKDEICGVLGVTEKVLDRQIKEHLNCEFDSIFNVLSAPGKICLRRYQFRMAKTSPQMAIFLGKNYLGQRDSFDDKNQSHAPLGIVEKIKELVVVDGYIDPFEKASVEHSTSTVQIQHLDRSRQKW